MKIFFYLDVTMNDSGSVALNNGFDNLAEEIFGQRFGQGTAFRDEVKQILARFQTLHHDYERISSIASVQQLDDA